MKKYGAASAKSLALVVLGFVCAAGTLALAYTAPTAAPTGGNVPAPVNTGTFAQTKSGDLQVGLPNASASLISRNWLFGVFGLFNNMLSSRRGAFVDEPGNAIVLNGQNGTDFLQAGITKNGYAEIAQGLTVNQYGNTLIKSLTPTTNTQAPVLDVQATSANGGGKIFSATGQQGGMTLWAKTGNAAFGFSDTNRAALSIDGNLSVNKEVQIGGGSPAQGKVLVAKDNLGTAEWGGGSTSTGGPDGLIKYVRAPIASGSVASAFCGVDAADDANWIAIGGGGYCQWGTQISQPVVNRSSSAHLDGHRTEPAIGWHLDCLDKMMDGGGGQVVGEGGNPGFAKAEVVCMKRTSVLTGITTTTPTGSTGGGASAPTPGWHLATGSGNPGESCVQWLTRTQQQGVISDVGVDIGPWGFLNFKHDTTGGKTNCAYSYPSQQIIPGSNVPGKTSCYYGSGTSNPGANATPVATCTDANAVTPAYNGTGTVQSVTATTWFYK